MVSSFTLQVTNQNISGGFHRILHKALELQIMKILNKNDLLGIQFVAVSIITRLEFRNFTVLLSQLVVNGCPV